VNTPWSRQGISYRQWAARLRGEETRRKNRRRKASQQAWVTRREALRQQAALALVLHSIVEQLQQAAERDAPDQQPDQQRDLRDN